MPSPGLAASADSAVAQFISKLKDVKASPGGRWMALCPAHDDSTRSLSVTSGADGRVLMRCHAGCTAAAIVAAIGLTMTDLFPAGSQLGAQTNTAVVQPAKGVGTRPKLVKSYDYVDADGALVFQACRLEPKSFRQRRRGENGDWIWNLDGVEPVLYHLPQVLEAVALRKSVYVVEGEKDADTLTELGYVATTSPMGAGKWRDAYADTLAGADVVVLPDNDQPGALHAEQIAASCAARGAAVRVVPLPGLAPKGDVTDWLNGGHDLDELESLVSSTAEWRPAGAPRRTRWRLDELLHNDSIMRPPPAVVPRLAWAGRSTLLAAREKSGKSTLIGYVASRVTRGDRFLGEPCATGDVLLIGLEEFIGDAARRLRHFDADAARVHLVDGFLGDPLTRPQELSGHIDAVDPVLVVIDSLAAFSHGMIKDDNSAAQMAAVVQPLTDLAHKRGIALMIVHHARKSDGRARGSTAITAGTDVVCEFFKPDDSPSAQTAQTDRATDPTLRSMRSAGRVSVPPSYDVRFDGRDYFLATAGETPLDARVVAVVQDRPGISMSDLRAAVGGRFEDVSRCVTDMLAKHTLVNTGDSVSRMKLVVSADANLSFIGGAR